MKAGDLSLLAALTVGLATSTHCVVMCGPLACALRARPLHYHGGRLLSYTAAGALAGAAGGGLLSFLRADGGRVVPWILAAVLLVIGLGWEKRLPQPAFLSGWLLRLRLRHTLGFLTPLLPCGPLWLVLAAASASGEWTRGSAIMAAFVLGTIPLPFLLQAQWPRLSGRLRPTALRWAQKGMALLGSALLTWRAIQSVHGSCH